ncbi:MAG: hypothetical protein KJ066_21440 [Acidobacteria bacterium]|nr:hypothetical protein [Acidobacteriota bacterium]
MAHTDGHGPHGPINHETTDVDLTGAKRLLLATGVFLAVVFAGLWGMLHLLHGRDEARQPAPLPVVERSGDRLPPAPRLQTLPYQDLAAFQAAERATLERYAWVDRSRGIAQIPIERAMDLVAEHGLPDAAPAGAGETAPAPTGPASNPTGGR